MDGWRWLLIAMAAALWPSVAIAQDSGRFSIDARWTIASTPSSPYAGTLRFTVAGTATKTPYGSIALGYAAPTLTGSLTSAPNGCTASSATIQTLSNGAPRIGIIAELDSTGSKVLLRFTLRYNWNLQCPDGSSSLLAGYEAVGACPTSSPCATSAPAELARITTDIYQLDTTGPNRPGTTLMLHARVSLVPVIPIASKLVNPNPALLDAQGQLAATTVASVASVAALTFDPKAAAIGTVADGVSKLLVVVDTKDPVRLTLPAAAPGQPPIGSLTSLTGESTISMTPVRVAGGGAERDLVVAVYTPPAHFGEPSVAAERILPITISSADQTTTQSIVLARPPLVVVGGLAAAPDDWKLFREQLAARGYPDTLNARRVWMTAFNVDTLQDLSTSLANRNVQAVGGDIEHALASYRVRGIAAAQVDVVAHGVGGLIARGYERTLRMIGRYATRDNYGAGPVHRLITIGTPHDGTEWGGLARVPGFQRLAGLIAGATLSPLPLSPSGEEGFKNLGRVGILPTEQENRRPAEREPLAGDRRALPSVRESPPADRESLPIVRESSSDRGGRVNVDGLLAGGAPLATVDLLAALAPGGDAYQRLGSTSITGGTHAIGATWAPDASASQAFVSKWLDEFVPGATLEALLCEEASDLIAGASSQLARRDAQSGGTLIGGTIHARFSDTVGVGDATQAAGGKGFAIVSALEALLNEAQTPWRLPTTFGRPLDRRCDAGVQSAALKSDVATIAVSNLPVTQSLPQAMPIGLSVTPTAVMLSDLNRVRRLTVLGIYDAAGSGTGTGTNTGTVMRDITSPALGTSYTLVSGEGIVDLSAAGVITARASGSAVIEVRHAVLVERINVTVACPAGPCLFVSPSTALADGGSVMRLYGGGFVAGTTIGVGGVLVPPRHVSVIDEHTLEFIVPPAGASIASAGGTADLIVSIPASGIPASSISFAAQAPSVSVLPAAIRYVPASSDPALDSELDGMPDRWEAQFGLNALSADGDGDVDGDGLSNAAEFAAGTHPDGVHTRYLAEGATGAFFSTSFALFNPGTAHATASVRFTTNAGLAARHVILVPAGTRRTIDASTIPGLANTSFSTVVESNEPIVIDRTMTWGGGYGSHADTAVVTPSPSWFLAEGSTSGDFELFYLLQNPQDESVSAIVRYLLPSGLAPGPPTGQTPFERTYTLPPHSRTTIAVDNESPALAATDVSAAISATAPIIVERAMYRSSPTQTFAAGHESAGVTAPATHWFLAEGATGPFFDLFILIANPNPSSAEVRVDYLLSTGETHSKTYRLAPQSRFTIWVDDEQLPEGSGIRPLANVAVSSTITSINQMPIVVERTMWWPGVEARAMSGAGGSEIWTEAHNSPGATETGAAWALAEGEVGGPLSTETYILIANTSDTSGQVMVTLHFEDGTTTSRTLDLMPRSRANVRVSADFPEAVGRKFGAVVRGLPGTSGLPPQLVVERAMYTSAGGETWSGGTNAMGTRIP